MTAKSKRFLVLILSVGCSITAYADGNGTGLAGQYFDDAASGGHLQGTPFTAQTDPSVNFNFVSAPPPALGRTTNFSVKWTGQVQPRYSEQYLFMTYSDDGVRVWVNGQLLINDWTVHPGTWDGNWITLQAGQLYTIEIDYFQAAGDADVQLWWQSPNQAKEIVPQSQLYSGNILSNANGTGLTGQYFDDAASGGHLQGTPFSARTDPSVNFDFVSAPPPGLGRTTDFSVKWTGQVQPRYSEQYLFLTYSDDGVRVWVNGQLLIDDWTVHPGTWDSNWITLQAGHLYKIEIDYFQAAGGANMQLWWQSQSQAREIVPPSQLYSGNGGSTYFVSPSGSDTNSGLSPSQAWQSVSRVNQQIFQPGDNILFARGGRYPGSLQPQGSGSPGSPISMGAYGRTGNLPVIDGTGQEAGVRIFNQQYWMIDSLEITGSQRFGVFISGDLANTALHYFRLTNLSVHDLYASPRWDSGLVMVAPIGDHTTFDNVTVDNVTAYDTNLWYGIHVGFNLANSYPTQPPMSTNITVRNSHVHDLYGDGITVAQSQHVLIEKNVAYETGQAPAGISYTPNAIWTWQSDQTIVQFNEGYSTHSYGVDGGVFDIDWGSTNTTVQYNYAHDADGYCVAVMGAHNVTTSNSIVRFNICSNNGRKAGMGPQEGDVFVTTFDGGHLDGVQIYNNTAYWNPAQDGGWIKARNLSLLNNLPTSIQNNILYSATPTLIDMDGSIPLDHNLYWLPTGSAGVWLYGSAVAAGFRNFRNLTGQDANGLFADPLLKNPTYSMIGYPTSAFTLNPGSPAVGNGASWPQMGQADFFGNSLPPTGSTDIGAQYIHP
jgi:hypothetical protein